MSTIPEVITRMPKRNATWQQLVITIPDLDRDLCVEIHNNHTRLITSHTGRTAPRSYDTSQVLYYKGTTGELVDDVDSYGLTTYLEYGGWDIEDLFGFLAESPEWKVLDHNTYTLHFKKIKDTPDSYYGHYRIRYLSNKNDVLAHMGDTRLEKYLDKYFDGNLAALTGLVLKSQET